MPTSPSLPSPEGPQRPAPQRGRLTPWKRRLALDREERARKEANWDGRIAWRWGTLLLLGAVVFPYGYRRGDGGQSLYHVLREASGLGVVAVLLPVLLGLAAVGVSFKKAAGLRVLVLLVGALATILLPLLLAHEVSSQFLPGRRVDAAFLAIAILLLAPPLVAGANRVQKRYESAAGFPRALVAAGGLLLVAALFYPLLPSERYEGGRWTVGSQSILRAVFLPERPHWHSETASMERLVEGWPIMLWVGLFLGFSLIAALFVVRRVRGRTAGDLLSFLARALLWSLPFVILIAGRSAVREGRFLPRVFLTAGSTLRLYGPLILLATGLALALQPGIRPSRPRRRRPDAGARRARRGA